MNTGLRFQLFHQYWLRSFSGLHNERQQEDIVFNPVLTGIEYRKSEGAFKRCWRDAAANFGINKMIAKKRGWTNGGYGARNFGTPNVHHVPTLTDKSIHLDGNRIYM